MAKTKQKGKRRPSKFNIAVGKFRRQGKTFKQSVMLAKRATSGRKPRKSKPLNRSPNRRKVRRATTRRVSAKRVTRKMVRRTKLTNLALMGIGGALKGTAGAAFKQFSPTGFATNVSDDTIAIILGFALDNSTKGIAKQIGQGLFVAGIAGFTEEVINKGFSVVGAN